MAVIIDIVVVIFISTYAEESQKHLKVDSLITDSSNVLLFTLFLFQSEIQHYF